MQKSPPETKLLQNGPKTLPRTSHPESGRNLRRTNPLQNISGILTNNFSLNMKTGLSENGIYTQYIVVSETFERSCSHRSKLPNCPVCIQKDIPAVLAYHTRAIRCCANLRSEPFPFWQKPYHSRHFHNSGIG